MATKLSEQSKQVSPSNGTNRKKERRKGKQTDQPFSLHSFPAMEAAPKVPLFSIKRHRFSIYSFPFPILPVYKRCTRTETISTGTGKIAKWANLKGHLTKRDWSDGRPSVKLQRFSTSVVARVGLKNMFGANTS